MHTKKRVELIIEKPAYKRACRILEESGAKGYTTFSAVSGFGAGVQWRRGTDLSASQDMLMVISVMDATIAEEAMGDLENLIGNHIGMLSISDVSVLRPDKF